MSGGNLRILSDDESEDESEDKSKGHGQQGVIDEPKEYVYKGLEATIVANFGESELHKLAGDYHCLINREPNFGQAEVIGIKPARSKYAEEINTELDNIRKKLTQIQKRELEFSEEESNKVKEFVRKQLVERSRNIVLYFKPLDRKVTVVGENFECVNETEHALKVFLGHIIQSNRGQRQLSTDNVEASIHKKTERPNTTSPQSNHKYPSYRTDEHFSFEIKFGKKFTLKVYKESITNVKVDVIVNAANDNLMHGGGVAKVIAKAAGYKLDVESRQHTDRNGLINVTENCLTCAGNLPYDAVIHAVGPQWTNYSNKVRCLDDVYWTVFNVLKECESRHYKSVGIPAISAGIYGVPKELCADMYVKAAVEFSETDPTYLKEMHFIDVDMEILKLVKDSVEKWEKSPDKINQKYTVPTCLESYSRQRPYNSSGQGKSNRRDRIFTFKDQTSVEDDFGGGDPLPCSVVESDKEKFQWGGEANVFLVGGAVTVKIFKSDIDKTRNIDALVCGIDTTLTSYGFIATALEKAGGARYKEGLKDMQKDAKRNDKRINAVLKSDAGDLGVRHVIHLVNDRITTAARDEEFKVYGEGIYQVLKKAKTWGIKTLALPMIGTGNIQYDETKLKRCCFALLHAVCDFCQEQDNPSVTDIHLINNNKSVCDALVSVFKRASDTDTSPARASSSRDGAPSYDSNKGYRGNDGRYSKPGHGGDEGKRSGYENDRSKHGQSGSSSSGRDKSDRSSYDKDKSLSSSFGEGRDHGSGKSYTKRTYTADGRADEVNTTDRLKKDSCVYEDMDVGNDDHESKSNEKNPPERGNLMIIEDD